MIEQFVQGFLFGFRSGTGFFLSGTIASYITLLTLGAAFLAGGRKIYKDATKWEEDIITLLETRESLDKEIKKIWCELKEPGLKNKVKIWHVEWKLRRLKLL